MLTLDPIPDGNLLQLSASNILHDDALTSKLMDKISENLDSAQHTVQEDEEIERKRKE